MQSHYLLAALALGAAAQWSSALAGPVTHILGWYAASDTHLGHDVGPAGGNVTTSYEKNFRAITEMNALPGDPNRTWPAALGGGRIAPPRGVVISGDLIDDGASDASRVNGCNQWRNFTALYGLDGTDGMLRTLTYEGRGNHDGGNTTDALPAGCATQPSTAIVARNRVRAADPAFAMDAVSNETGLHYSWTWPLGAACRIHFVHLNLFSGHTCGSPANPTGEGKPPGYPCARDGWTYAEYSQDFLEADLAAHAAAPGTLVVAVQHLALDGWSRTWWNPDQAAALVATLARYRTLLIHVGHTHGAALYSFNGTDEGVWGQGGGFINVMTAPATQKEAGDHAPLPSEFMVLEASLADGAANGTLRVAQRVGAGWGDVMGEVPFVC